jgi:hypothetical protein
MDYEALGRYTHNKAVAQQLSVEIGECSRAIHAGCNNHTYEAVDTNSIKRNNEKLMKLEKDLTKALHEANHYAQGLGKPNLTRGEYE